MRWTFGKELLANGALGLGSGALLMFLRSAGF